MSSTRPFLIFDLNGALFGLDATLVRESVWLPELAPVEEAPPYIVGILSLREQLIPVTDLSLRFGHPAIPYSLNNQVVVLEQERLTMGIIVSEVREVAELPQAAIQPPPQFDVEMRPDDGHLISGEAKLGGNIVTLLDASRLVRLPQNLAPAETEHPAYRFCPEATPEQHAVYRARARALQEDISAGEITDIALAVLEMGGEYFGVDLDAVQEFCEISQFSPVPCCPRHILGVMSLRGNLYTLLDLRAALNLPLSAPGGKAVLARLGQHTMGIAVNEVHDVVYLRREELQDAPAALQEQHASEVRSVIPYAGRMMLVLDLPALLAREEWVVNET